MGAWMNGRADDTRLGDTTIEDWLQLIRAEYLEIPGLRLTREQMQRLWGLDAAACQTLLAMLVEVGFLRCTRQAAYVRSESE
jgi:hypothetical protein